MPRHHIKRQKADHICEGPMQALILAGGFGTRIRPLTYTRPKPLLPVANRAMVDRVLDSMPKDVDTVVIPINYLADLMRQHFEDHPDPRVVLVDEPEPLGTGGAIKNCEKHFDDRFFVYNADIVSSIDLDAMMKQHVQRKAEASISLWRVDEPWHFGVVQLNGNGRIQNFVEKPPKGQEPSDLINAGHYLLEPSVLDRIPSDTFVSLEKEAFTPMAKEGGGIFGYEFDGFWIDSGRPETYLEAHRLWLAHQKKPNVQGSGATGLKAAKFTGYAMGDDVTLGPASRIERSVLFNGVHVGTDCVIEDSVLGEGVEVEDGVHLSKCVVGDFATIEAKSKIQGKKIGMRPGDEK
jgi:NDP-sugar pyrophosphorylase family protein